MNRLHVQKKHLSEARRLQELLGGAGAKIKQVWGSQAEDPRVHLVSYLKGESLGILQLLAAFLLHTLLKDSTARFVRKKLLKGQFLVSKKL